MIRLISGNAAAIAALASGTLVRRPPRCVRDLAKNSRKFRCPDFSGALLTPLKRDRNTTIYDTSDSAYVLPSICLIATGSGQFWASLTIECPCAPLVGIYAIVLAVNSSIVL